MPTLINVIAQGCTLQHEDILPELPLISKGYHREIELVGNHWRYVADRSPFTSSEMVIVDGSKTWSVE